MDIIKEDVFRKQLKNGLSGGYLFFGEEDYLKSFTLRSARETVCPDPTFAVFNDVRIDPLDYSADALLNAIAAPPMMAEQKIISVNGLAICDLKASELDELYDTLSVLPEYDHSVLIISVPAGLMDEGNLPKKPSAVLAELSERLTPVQFEAVTGARLAAWVKKHLEHHGATADMGVCTAIIERCGSSMFTLSAETEKVAYYVLSQGRTQVTQADVENVVCAIIDAGAFALTNAILEGRHEQAIEALNAMKFRREEPVNILGEVSRAVCEMLSAKLLIAEGVSVADMTRILRFKSDYRTKKCIQAVQNKSEDKLRRALLLCSEADLQLKRSMQGYEVIERLICCL